MINEKFIDIRNQKSILESLLSKLKENSPYSSAFDKTKYSIINSSNTFCGRYDEHSDEILIDKWFVYDSMCSSKLDDVKNLLIHEEAHRQNHLRGTYKGDKPDHWIGWLKVYFEMGGRIPEVYLKNKLYEHEIGYKEIKEEDFKNIIILGYNNSEKAAEILRKAKDSRINFIYIDANKNIHNY